MHGNHEEVWGFGAVAVETGGKEADRQEGQIDGLNCDEGATMTWGLFRAGGSVGSLRE